MQTTEFVAVPVERLRPCIVVAERHGWSARFTENRPLREEGVEGRLVRLDHADSPFPLILFRGASGACLTGLRNHCSEGYAWSEVVSDGEVAEGLLDDAPVAGHLAAELTAPGRRRNANPRTNASGASAA